MDDPRLWISLMDFQRHEWMNDLQLLFGYVRLKKYDKLPDVVEKLKNKAHGESRMTKLGIPELVMELLVFRMANPGVELVVEPNEDANLAETPVRHDRMTSAVMGVMHALAGAADAQSEDKPLLTLSLSFDGPFLLVQIGLKGEYQLSAAVDGLSECLFQFQDALNGEYRTDYGDLHASVWARIPFEK